MNSITLTEQEIDEATANLTTCIEDYSHASAHLILTKDNLEVCKLEKLASGEIDGKNAELREACARVLLKDQYIALIYAEEQERQYRLKLDLARLGWERIKLILRLAEVAQQNT